MKVTYDLSTLLTKIRTIFKNDLYIVDYTYVIAGDESEDRNETQILVRLDPNFTVYFKSEYPESSVIYIKNIREAKKNLEENINLNITNIDKENLYKKINKIKTFVEDNGKWNKFKLSDSEVNELFVEGSSINLFSDTDLFPPVTVGKNIFPGVSEKNFNDLSYKIYLPETEDELVNLFTTITNEYFQIYNLIQYIILC